MLSSCWWSETSPDVRAIVDRLWGPDADGARVWVGAGRPPEDHVAVERYRLWPSTARPRFLLPSDAPAAARAALTRDLVTTSRRSRVLGAVGSLGLRNFSEDGLLTVAVHRDVAVDERHRHLVLEHAARATGQPDLVAVIPVRRQVPSAKPTARLYSRTGALVGHLKTGWSEATEHLVRTEHETLLQLDGEVGDLTTPRVLAGGRWEGTGPTRHLLVAAGLPSRLRPWSTSPQQDPGVVRAVADSGARSLGALDRSAYAGSVRDRLEVVASLAEGGALAGWWAALCRNTTVIQFGRWHGDWVTWNLARTRRGDGVVWDWEYSAPSAPVGFDLLHWHFQHALAAADATLMDADAAARSARQSLQLLDVSPADVDLVTDLYVFEMSLRATWLASQGCGWNPKVRPWLLSLVQTRSDSIAESGRCV